MATPMAYNMTTADVTPSQATAGGVGTAQGYGQFGQGEAMREYGLGQGWLGMQRQQLADFIKQARQQRKRQMMSDIVGALVTAGTLGAAGPIAGALGVGTAAVSSMAPVAGQMFGSLAGGGTASPSLLSYGAGALGGLGVGKIADLWGSGPNTYAPTTLA